jgi:hypothetical protein
MDAPKKKVRTVKEKTGEKPGEAAKVTPEQVCQGILPLDSIVPPSPHRFCRCLLICLTLKYLHLTL